MLVLQWLLAAISLPCICDEQSRLLAISRGDWVGGLGPTPVPLYMKYYNFFQISYIIHIHACIRSCILHRYMPLLNISDISYLNKVYTCIHVNVVVRFLLCRYWTILFLSKQIYLSSTYSLFPSPHLPPYSTPLHLLPISLSLSLSIPLSPFICRIDIEASGY